MSIKVQAIESGNIYTRLRESSSGEEKELYDSVVNELKGTLHIWKNLFDFMSDEELLEMLINRHPSLVTIEQEEEEKKKAEIAQIKYEENRKVAEAKRKAERLEQEAKQAKEEAARLEQLEEANVARKTALREQELAQAEWKAEHEKKRAENRARREAKAKLKAEKAEKNKIARQFREKQIARSKKG